MAQQRGSIPDRFERGAAVFSDLNREVQRLLNELLGGVSFHSITGRLKSGESLIRKIEEDPSKYRELQDVTDVCAARVTTYFEDDVDAVAKIIEREFEVDGLNSVDKRKAVDPDRFGYSSLHYVVSFNKARTALPEYRRFDGKKIEIQIRSILQHAWAEIEHDLQYKSALAVPLEIRRKFARLAGLLELADSEFKQIRDATEDYRRRTTEKVKLAESKVSIDIVLLGVFIRERPIVNKVDAEIAAAVNVQIRADIMPNLDSLISMASALGIQSISQLEDEMVQRSSEVVAFAKAFIMSSVWGPKRIESFSSGISTPYVIYFLLAKQGGVETIRTTLGKVAFPGSGPDLDLTATELWKALR